MTTATESLPPLHPVVQMAGPWGVGQPGYYGLPFLKRPRWKWEIALYFFFEGMSAGSFVTGTMADLFAHQRYPGLVRTSRWLALAALLPCPPLLIADLGRPERFLHMLRVVKLTSPMNTGAWALTGYGMLVTLIAGSELKLLRYIPARVVSVLALPFAVTMLAYPGVLLSTTSNPVWSGTRLLGPVIASSSMTTAVAALALATTSRPDGSSRALKRLETVVSVCETASLIGYLGTARETARPLTSGPQAIRFWAGAVAGGIIAPALLSLAESRIRSRSRARTVSVAASVLRLGGALMLKWAITYAGRDSAHDSEAGRAVTQPSESAPGWTP